MKLYDMVELGTLVFRSAAMNTRKEGFRFIIRDELLLAVILLFQVQFLCLVTMFQRKNPKESLVEI